MKAQERREKIREVIARQEKPTTATELAKLLQVSRQIIVGDVALLRAQGCDIVATARGYIAPHSLNSGYVGTVASHHNRERTPEELYTIVDAGARVINVIVSHDLYGEITGQLNLASREDVDAFLGKAEHSRAKLLSELTEGVHLHTIRCRDADHFERVRQALEESDFLYGDTAIL